MEHIVSPEEHRSGRWKKIIIVAGLIVMVTAVLWARNQKQIVGPKPDVPQRGSVQSTTSEKSGTAKQDQTEPLPRLIDLGADKCVPCKMMAPILEELKEEYRGMFEVIFIDVWKDPQPGRQYKIRVIPTQIFLDGSGNELFRHEGFFSKQDILNKWSELGIAVQEQ
jgi:thiol-disulfide isomerase/thioredoxin